MSGTREMVLGPTTAALPPLPAQLLGVLAGLEDVLQAPASDWQVAVLTNLIRSERGGGRDLVVYHTVQSRCAAPAVYDALIDLAAAGRITSAVDNVRRAVCCRITAAGRTELDETSRAWARAAAAWLPLADNRRLTLYGLVHQLLAGAPSWLQLRLRLEGKLGPLPDHQLEQFQAMAANLQARLAPGPPGS